MHRFLHSMKEPYKEVFSLRTFGELPFDKIGGGARDVLSGTQTNNGIYGGNE